MSIFSSRRFWLAVASIALLVAGEVFGKQSDPSVADALVDLGFQIAAIVGGLLASYGLREHPSN